MPPGSTLYTGSQTTITIAPHDETGSYVVDLYRSTTRIARVATGPDISAVTSVKWVIPTTMKLEGAGYTFVVDTPSGSPFTDRVHLRHPTIRHRHGHAVRRTCR